MLDRQNLVALMKAAAKANPSDPVAYSYGDKKLGYEVADEPAPKEYKDYNEWLKKEAKEKEQGEHKEVLAR